ncbi:PEGA domain-containing protein, partial [Corallococcus sp. AB050B]
LALLGRGESPQVVQHDAGSATSIEPEVPVVVNAPVTVDSGTPVVVAEVTPDAGPPEETRDAGQVTVVDPPVTPASPPVVVTKPVTTRRPALTARRELPKGKVEFRVRPFGLVYLDGKPLGQTPFAAVEATEGMHKVRVVNNDLGKDVTKAFEVKAGQDNVFKLNLAAE